MQFRLKRNPSELDVVIEKMLCELQDTPGATKEHNEILTAIERLEKLKAQRAKSKLSPDIAVTSAVHLVGIGMILHHEQFNVITSKALSFVPKLKA